MEFTVNNTYKLWIKELGAFYMPADYFNESPIFLRGFLSYIRNIQGKSPITVQEYFYDLRMFFRYMLVINHKISANEFETCPINKIEESFLKQITLDNIYEYLNFLSTQRYVKKSSQARRVASIKSFFKYLHVKTNLIDENPAVNLETPKIRKSLPEYLTLEESIKLLDTVDGKYKERDYCILLLFISCGLRLAELVGINVSDFRNNVLRVRGKGDKVRDIPLNENCMEAIHDYLESRLNINGIIDMEALFLSKRKTRISRRTVQYIVKKYIGEAGLDTEKLSTHKLRHTAGTLMYQYGTKDLRAIQQILGHAHVSTTEIYTHVGEQQTRETIESNPISNYKKKN